MAQTTYSHSGIATTVDGNTVTISTGSHTADGYIPNASHRVQVATQRLTAETVAAELPALLLRHSDIAQACRALEETHSLTRGQLHGCLRVL